MRTMRSDVEDHPQKPQIFIEAVRTLHVTSLNADMAEFGGRIGKENKSPVFMHAVVSGELGEIVASSGRPAFGKLVLHPTHEAPALDRVVRAHLLLAPEDFV